MEIARSFLIPRQIEAHGLKSKHIEIADSALHCVIESYTREAGVRNLEREIAKICRKIARRIVEGGKSQQITVTSETVHEYLGKIRFHPRRKNEESEVGVSTGLAWTEAGGELLETEVGLMQGKGKLILTGKLGEVMQESARAAVSYLRSRADLLGIDPEFNDNHDLHIHVPEGAIPKDGPSAGITMATALISAATGVPVRKDLAMTGEITLRGKVLPVGGVKHKLLAAYRAGITELIIPKLNEKDLDEIPPEVRERLELHLVESMDEVLSVALDGEVSPLSQRDAQFEETTSEPPGQTGPVAH
jgi:ATP-dependent Lon protease